MGSETNWVKVVRAVFNRTMETNSYKAADNEAPMAYEDQEKVMKEMMVDNGFSCEIVAHNWPVDDRRDRFSNMETKLNQLENKVGYKGDKKSPTASRALVGNKEVCHKFNSAEGN